MKKVTLLCVGITVFLVFLSACSKTVGNNPSCAPAGVAVAATAMETHFAHAVFRAINQSRADNKRPPLTWSAALANSARRHNLVMQKANTLSHQLPGEDDPGVRENLQCVDWSEAGENIGESTELTVDGALWLHQAMMNEQTPEDGHRQNILNTNFSIVGVDILIDRQNGVLWLTEDFADTSVSQSLVLSEGDNVRD